MPEEQSIVKKVGAVTQHQVSKELSEHSQNLSDIEMPFRVENVTMMSPGTWNGKDYRPEEIRQAYNRTNWEDPDVKSLFNEHDDHDSRDWIGEIKNPRMDGDELVADMDIVTADEARKVAYGARFGISPKVSGRDRADVMQDFGYDNFSLVLDPAVKTTYLNSEHNTDDDNDKPGVKNVMVKTNMSEEDQTEELSSEDKAKVEEIVSTVENSDVEELANVIAPFVGDASAEQLQPHIESVVENAEDDEYKDKDKEMDGHEDDEEMRDMEEIARRAAEQVATEIMGDEDGDDDGGDEQSLSVDEIADKVAEKVEVENSDDEEDDSSDEVDALKEELSEIKEQLSQDEEDDKTTIENKTPNPGSESTGTDGASSEKDIQEMSDKEIDTGAAKYLLRKQSRSI